MNTPTVLSDCSSRHRHRRKGSSKRSLALHSDHFEEAENRDTKDIPLRSSSSTHIPATLGAPRMAQLETLEAKMASIEVSLSTTPRRRKSGPLGGRARDTPAKDQDPLRAQIKDKENMIQSLKDQLCTTMNINRISHKYIREGGSGAPLPEAERRAAEERTTLIHQDIDTKRLAIKNLKVALDRLDITDNIDVRIQQAELEYQLGREELELLTLLEQSRALQLLIEQDDYAKTKQDQQTIYSCMNEADLVTLHAVQVEYDPKSPQFGAGPRLRLPGLWLEWALEHTGMCKGDRLLEVNGKLVLSKSKEDMLRLLSISPSPAQLVVLRSRSSADFSIADLPKSHPNPQSALAQVGSLRAELDSLREQAEEAKRTKDGLRSDNLRLTHRISYLEEQVADLLERNKTPDPDVKLSSPQKLMTSTVKTQKNVTNISITSEPNPKVNQTKPEVQVFQKGPDVTAIVANIPGLEIGGKDTVEACANLPIIRPRSNQSNISSTQIEIGNGHKSSVSRSSNNSVDHNDNPKRFTSNPQSNHIHYNHKYNKNSNSRYSLQPSRSSQFLSQGEDELDSNPDKKPYCLRQSLSHHSIHTPKEHKNFDYNSETSAALEIIKKNQQQYMESTFRGSKEKRSKAQSDDNSDVIKSYKREHRKFTMGDCFSKESKDPAKLSSSKHNGNHHYQHRENKLIQDTQPYLFTDKRISYNSHKDEYIDFHPERDYIDHRIDGKMIQNAHKSSRRLSKLHVRNFKSPDCDSEPTQITNEDKYRKSRTKHIDYTSEPNSIMGHHKKNIQYLDRPRPTPPKKPIRLSLHRAQSMQSVEPELSQSEKFYLHDPVERLKLSTDLKNSEELRFSLTNNKNLNDDVNDKENKTKKDMTIPYHENAHMNNRLRHQSKEYSKSEELIENSVSQSDKEHHDMYENKKHKKRIHDSKLTHLGNELTYIHDMEHQNGYASSRSESLSSISKSQQKKMDNHLTSSGENLYSMRALTTSDGSRLGSTKEEKSPKRNHKENNSSKTKKTNGHAHAEHMNETPKSNSHSGFKWSTPTIFKNMRIDSSSRVNGHHVDKK